MAGNAGPGLDRSLGRSLAWTSFGALATPDLPRPSRPLRSRIPSCDLRVTFASLACHVSQTFFDIIICDQGTAQGKTMIKVLYFAAARDEIGLREEEFALDGVKVVADLRAKLCAKYASAAEILRGVTFARNLEYVEDDAPVHAGDEIAVIPPISGG